MHAWLREFLSANGSVIFVRSSSHRNFRPTAHARLSLLSTVSELSTTHGSLMVRLSLHIGRHNMAGIIRPAYILL
jgi:hypothetical protein